MQLLSILKITFGNKTRTRQRKMKFSTQELLFQLNTEIYNETLYSNVDVFQLLNVLMGLLSSQEVV